MMRRIAILTTLVLLLLWLPGLQASEVVSISGYLKNFSIVIDQPKVTNLPNVLDQPIIGAVNNRLRVDINARSSEWLSFSAAYDFSPRVQDKSLFDEQMLSLGLSSPSYRVTDFDSRFYPDENDSVTSFAVFHNLDRAFVTIKSEFADFYLGRQAIAWGSAHVISATDIIAPYAFDELDVEDRVGVDALRVRVPLGFMGEIDAGYVAGDDFRLETSAIFLRGRFYYRGNDITFLVLDFKENLLLGFDLTRAVGGAGFWFEGGYVFVDAFGDRDLTSDDDYLRGSVGFDYSLKNGTYLLIEYHFSQAGTNEPDAYFGRLTKTAYQEGSVYLLGRHYLVPALFYQVTPLVTLSGEVLINLNNPSAFLAPLIEYNIAENIYLSAGAYLGFGRNPIIEIDQHDNPVLRLRSEFGSYPDFLFTSFRLYF